MNGLAERLEGGGSFNIEVVITPLKDMISTAIMEYHGSTKAISDQVSRVTIIVIIWWSWSSLSKRIWREFPTRVIFIWMSWEHSVIDNET